MVVLRHLNGSDPSIEVTDEEAGGEAAQTVYFQERPPKAALNLTQESRSVVIHDTLAPPVAGDPTDVTQMSRQKRESRQSISQRLLVWIESHWVVVAIGLAIVTLALTAARLRR